MSNEALRVSSIAKSMVYDRDTSAHARAEVPHASSQYPVPVSPPNPIEAIDAWSRHVWRFRRRSIAILLALPLWLGIRVGYRVASVVGSLSYYLSRPFVWTYWRLYETFGPAARKLKQLYWKFIYPVLELVWSCLRAIFWRLYALCGPIARTLKPLFWATIAPVMGLGFRTVRWIYWRILFPVLRVPASLLGFDLAGASTAATSGPAESKLDEVRDAFARGLSDADAIAWVANDLSDFEALFDCAPRFGLQEPSRAHLFILCGVGLRHLGARQLRLLGLRLRSGAPCKNVHLYALDPATQDALSGAFGLDVRSPGTADPAEFIELVRARALDAPPSLLVDRFGPVVLVISALWGRVGSTLIFDAQTQFLIENGAFVVRVLVDHNPELGPEGSTRQTKLVAENLTQTYPHLLTVAMRDLSLTTRSRLHRRAEYQSRSGVRRFELELENAIALDPTVLNWAGAMAEFTVVNHAMHMAFAERVSPAPIVLETHDVLIHQIESHGWPNFVSLKNEPTDLRDIDQKDLWRRAEICVNLTPDDHAEISAHAKEAVFIRPTAESTTVVLRSWQDVVSANSLSRDFAQNEQFDIVMWGDWHQGNARAVHWFFDHVLPASPALSQARIAIVGRVTRLLPPNVNCAPNVVTADFVDKLDDFLGRAKVLVIADQDTSGVSIKAIEAIRYGLPFVATKAGLRGLDLHGVDVPAHETAAAFADDLATLLNDPSARAARAGCARELFKRNISHDAYEEKWRRILEKVEQLSKGVKPSKRIEPAALSGPSSALRLTSTRLTGPILTRHEHVPGAVGRISARVTHRLAAVVCTYNRYDVLPGAIESLLRQDMAESDLDIIVVDNSPDQDAAERFSKAYAGTRVRYLLEAIPGLSNARNVGAEVASATHVAYIDDDAVAAPDWARKLVSAFQHFSPGAGIAGGRIIPRWITPRPDWLPDELIGNLSIVDWGGHTRPLGRSEWLAGCNIAFERNTLIELGGFSTALGRTGAGVALLSNEESAVIEKFAAHGRGAIYVPDATVEHLIEPARLSQDWFRRRAAWQAVSDFIKDPKKATAYSGAAAERLRRELSSDDQPLPPGFVRPHSERESFRRDVGLMYDVVIAMLAGGVELNEAGGSDASLQDRLVANVRREVQRNPQLRAAIRKLKN